MSAGERIDEPLTAELVAGAADSPTLVLAHGVTQNRHCWGEFAEHLGRRFAVWAVDLPGHGDSGHDAASFEVAAHLLADTTGVISERSRRAPHPGEPHRRAGPILVGYSMGGRLALRAVLDRPGVVSALVLIGATAGLDDAADRAARRAADAEIAARLRTEGPARFLDRWLALALFADLDPQQQLRDARLRHWGSGVAATFEHRGTGSMEPMWDRLGELTLPTLVLAGADDPKFVAIGGRLAAGLGGPVSVRRVAGTGHACQLAAPARTAELVTDWWPAGRPAG